MSTPVSGGLQEVTVTFLCFEGVHSTFILMLNLSPEHQYVFFVTFRKSCKYIESQGMCECH